MNCSQVDREGHLCTRKDPHAILHDFHRNDERQWAQRQPEWIRRGTAKDLTEWVCR